MSEESLICLKAKFPHFHPPSKNFFLSHLHLAERLPVRPALEERRVDADGGDQRRVHQLVCSACAKQVARLRAQELGVVARVEDDGEDGVEAQRQRRGQQDDEGLGGVGGGNGVLL